MEEKQIGSISHCFSKISVGIIELTDTLKVGDTIHIKGCSDDFTQLVDSMQIEHASVTEAKAGDSVGIKVTGKVHENDIVYRVIA
ncbi:MAG: translation elongation factor-like protein [Candidatus Omnitrophota bacterium]|nr:translation elongation factor-like protein [Candidatus Omnitrophota bacterium]